MKKLFNTNYSKTAFSVAILLLRVTMGGLLIPHGYNKLTNFGTLSQTFSDPFHLGSTVSVILVIFAEIFCSILVIIGLCTRFACIPPAIAMAVVVFVNNHGNMIGKAELPTLYLAGFLAIMLVGPGRFSFDRLIWK